MTFHTTIRHQRLWGLDQRPLVVAATGAVFGAVATIIVIAGWSAFGPAPASETAGQSSAAAVTSEAAFGLPDVSLDRDAGLLFDQINGSGPAPASLAGVAEAGPVVYVVGSEEQLQAQQQALDESDLIRSQFGLGALGGQVLLVPQDVADTFLGGLEDANGIRAVAGLPPFTVVDLR